MMTRTTAAPSVPAEDSRTTVERRWMSVVFLQGEEAAAVLETIERTGPEMAISLVPVGLRRRDARRRGSFSLPCGYQHRAGCGRGANAGVGVVPLDPAGRGPINVVDG